MKRKIKILAAEVQEPKALDAKVMSILNPSFRIDGEALSKDISRMRGMLLAVQNSLSESGLANPNSPTQVFGWMESLGLRVPEVGPKNARKKTASVDAIFVVGLDEHPQIKLLLSYRSQSRLVNAASAMLAVTFDEVIRPKINPDTKSGRIYLSDPAICNFPRELRKYVMPVGKAFIKADYKAAELCLMAVVSGDRDLANAIKSGDPHRATAAKMLKIHPEHVTKEQRQIGKILNFGIPFGMTTGGIISQAAQLGIRLTREQAGEYIKFWQGAFPTLNTYIVMIEDDEAETWTGRKAAYKITGMASRGPALLAYQCQAGIADFFKLKLIALAEAGHTNVIPLHDGVLISSDAIDLEAEAAKVESIMNDMFLVTDDRGTFNMPMVVEIETGERW